ncbi:Shr3 amino acid permease chaperone [Phanerochaete sordida]|uniref:Shr3 amino acid permease chaperone n=1 Tax=Phanerochaete sordida TaxID=48140 RepID=A0A9P3GMK2_9APHY|nr:Shr3 amino acid permease chaperone [Phanerochaete sordida]
MSVVVSATAFLLGLLFTHWIADSLTLWKSPETQSDARLWTAATYYAILSRVPPALLYVYSGVALLGGATLFWSLGDLRAGNLMFDGGSILLYSSAAVMYVYSVLPNLVENFKPLPLPFVHQPTPMASTLAKTSQAAALQELPPFPPSLRGPTLELASSHLMCCVALTGVLVLQAGRWWAEQKDLDDDEDEPSPQPKEQSKKES